MLNLPGNLEHKVPFEGRSKNQLCVYVRKQGKGGERERTKTCAACSNSYTAHWRLCTILGEIMNNDVLSFEFNYSVLQVSPKSFTNMSVPSQISGRHLSRYTLEQTGRKHCGLIF